MFVIESGQVAVKVGSAVTDLFAGDFLGEMSLLTGAPRNATVTAVEPVAAYEIRKHVLAPVLAGSPTLVERLAETMEKRQIDSIAPMAAAPGACCARAMPTAQPDPKILRERDRQAVGSKPNAAFHRADRS